MLRQPSITTGVNIPIITELGRDHCHFQGVEFFLFFQTMQDMRNWPVVSPFDLLASRGVCLGRLQVNMGNMADYLKEKLIYLSSGMNRQFP